MRGTEMCVQRVIGGCGRSWRRRRAWFVCDYGVTCVCVLGVACGVRVCVCCLECVVSVVGRTSILLLWLS
jgi:hypothetical protein